MDYDEIPGVQVHKFDELAGAVAGMGAMEDPDKTRRLLDGFLGKYMSGCDGKSTQRIMKLIRNRKGSDHL